MKFEHPNNGIIALCLRIQNKNPSLTSWQPTEMGHV